MGNNTVKEVHDKVMDSIHDEWIKDEAHHTERRKYTYGIRSSQISALVMYLIKIGVIKEEEGR